MFFEAEWLLRLYRLKGNGFRFLRFLPLRLQLAVDRDIGILVETRVRFHARFRLGAAFEDRIVVFEEPHAPFEGFYGMVMFECVRLTLRLFDQLFEEPHAPFEGFYGMVMFECVRLTLRLFDQFAVRDTRRRPVGREMVRI